MEFIILSGMSGAGKSSGAAILEDLGYNADEIAKTCPNCEELFYNRYTHLPLYGLSDEQLKYMADAVLESVAEMQAGK